MPAGYYNVLHNEDKTALVAEVAPGSEGIPPADQQNLLIGISDTLSMLQLIYPVNSGAFKRVFDQLFYLAKVGLEGVNPQPALSAAVLIQLKKEIVDREAGRVKNNYLRMLGKLAVYLGLAPLLAGTTLHFIPLGTPAAQYINLPATANMLILWSGTMLGVWLSFAITKINLQFEDLAILEKDRLEPLLRLLFTGALAVVFGLLFMKRALVVELGNISSASVASDHIIAFVMGVGLGLNERMIGRMLWKKSEQALTS